MPVVLVAAEMDELFEVVEEFAGEEVIDEFCLFELLEIPEYCEAATDVDATLLADLSKTDIRLLGLNFGVPLKGTTKKNLY